MISRVPPNLRHQTIRKRRETEEATSQHTKLGDFLDHPNDLIHDNDLSYMSVKGTTTHDVKRQTTSKTLVGARGGNRSINARFYHLCKTNGHYTSAHKFESHGEMTISEVKGKSKKHALCYRCGLPIKGEAHAGARTCTNVVSCSFCSATNHVGILCEKRKMNKHEYSANAAGRFPTNIRATLENDKSKTILASA